MWWTFSTLHPGGYHHRGCDCMLVGFTTTYAISAYHHQLCEFESRSGELYLIHHYVIKFVSDLWQVHGILQVLQFPSPIKNLQHITEILLKVALSTINQTNQPTSSSSSTNVIDIFKSTSPHRDVDNSMVIVNMHHLYSYVSLIGRPLFIQK